MKSFFPLSFRFSVLWLCVCVWFSPFLIQWPKQRKAYTGSLFLWIAFANTNKERPYISYHTQQPLKSNCLCQSVGISLLNSLYKHPFNGAKSAEAEILFHLNDALCFVQVFNTDVLICLTETRCLPLRINAQSLFTVTVGCGYPFSLSFESESDTSTDPVIYTTQTRTQKVLDWIWYKF